MLDMGAKTISCFVNAKGWAVIPKLPPVDGVYKMDHYDPLDETHVPIERLHTKDGRDLDGELEFDVVREMTHSDEIAIYGIKSALSTKAMRRKHNWDDPKVRAFYGEQ